MKAEDILVRAAELVERPGGWCQGISHQRPDGAFCLQGAIACTNPTEWLEIVALQAVAQEIGSNDIAGWNDAPGRSAQEVATALRNAKRHLVAP